MYKNLYNIGTRLKARHFKIQSEKWFFFFYQLYRFFAVIKTPCVCVRKN